VRGRGNRGEVHKLRVDDDITIPGTDGHNHHVVHNTGGIWGAVNRLERRKEEKNKRKKNYTIRELVSPESVDLLVMSCEVLFHGDRGCEVRGGHGDDGVDGTWEVVGEGDHGAGHNPTHGVTDQDDGSSAVGVKVLEEEADGVVEEGGLVDDRDPVKAGELLVKITGEEAEPLAG